MSTTRKIEPWPIAVVAVLLSMAGVLAALVFFATTNPAVIVDEDPFQASEAYNEAFRKNQDSQ